MQKRSQNIQDSFHLLPCFASNFWRFYGWKMISIQNYLHNCSENIPLLLNKCLVILNFYYIIFYMDWLYDITHLMMLLKWSEKSSKRKSCVGTNRDYFKNGP